MKEVEKKTTLYDLLAERDQTLHTVYQLIMQNQGELTPELERQLENVNPDLPQKVDSYHLFISGCDRQADEMEEIARQATKAARSLRRVGTSVEIRMGDIMRSRKIDEMQGHKFRFKLIKCVKGLEITDAKTLDAKYVITETVTTFSPDKEKIKLDLIQGIPVAGARLTGGDYVKRFINTKD